LLALSAALTGLQPTPCQADNPLEQGTLSLGAGIFFGYQASSRPGRSGFEWGLEAFATHRFGTLGDCENHPRAGIGPLIQLGIKGVQDPRLTLALQGGGEFSRGVGAISAEIGASYRFGRDPGPSLHLGIVPEFILANAALRYQLGRDEWFVGGGLRFLPTYGQPGFCSEGRPLRTQDGKCVPKLFDTADTPELAAALAYAEDAQMECISIASFLQVALELRAIGAPEALVLRAFAAAEDELRHTQLCAALARRLADVPVLCSMPEPRPRSLQSREALRMQLALESYEDGCVGEAAAADQLARSATTAADSVIASCLRAMARDEASHTRLAWDIVHYCAAVGGEPVQRALHTGAKRLQDMTWTTTGRADLARYGRMSAHAFAQLAQARASHAALRLRHGDIVLEDAALWH
jgi:hypothetical protein